MTWKRALLASLVLSVAIGVVYGYAFSPRSVAVAVPFRGDAAQIVYATGVVEPRTWAKVTPLVRERIVELCNCEGRKLDRYAVLARLDDGEAKAVLAELRAREQLATEEFRRQTALADRNVTTQQSLERARSEVARLEALIAAQTARLASLVLRSPSDGVVLRQDGQVGEIAEPGTVLFWVGQPRPLLVVAEVNEENIPQIAIGQRALLRSDAFPDRRLEAVVDSVTPKGDPTSKTYRVRFALPDDTLLMIGMTVEVNVVIRIAENALLVPASGVDGNAAFIVDPDGIARRRELTLGIRGTVEVEVQSGLDEHARVIAPFPKGLIDGDRVKIIRR
ncbi:MAG: efflux RND transporter periplasmic adaptor subunit [Hyphomonadaceae bacterium]|nr:efflux RND transporter periplasmic adaptor subunit [Hyphomonadaceae bacterium]